MMPSCVPTRLIGQQTRLCDMKGLVEGNAINGFINSSFEEPRRVLQ